MNIYLVQQEGTNFYKIGITKKEPGVRLKELQTGNPIQLLLVRFYQTKYNYLLESGLHNHFKLKQVNSEWFELSNDDIDNFETICKNLENSFEILKENPFFNRGNLY